jgi:hypothetical protein
MGQLQDERLTVAFCGARRPLHCEPTGLRDNARQTETQFPAPGVRLPVPQMFSCDLMCVGHEAAPGRLGRSGPT